MRWEKVKLEDLCISITDGDHQSLPLAEKGIPFIVIADINNNNRIEFDKARFVSLDYYEKLDIKRKPQKGNVLLTVKGSFGIPVYVADDKPFVFQRDIAILKCNEKITPLFLYYYMKNREFYKYTDSIAIGAAQRAITLKALKNTVIKLPPLETQYGIAKLLSVFDNLIENNQKQIKLLEEAAQRLYKEWFVDLRFPGRETTPIVDGVPEGWSVVKLSDVATVNKSSISKRYPYDYVDYVDLGSVSKGRIEAITRFSIQEAPGRAKRVASDGDIIWGMVRPNLKSYALVFHPAETSVFSTGFAVLSAKKIPFSFLYCHVTQDDFVGYLVNCTNGAAYPAVKPIHFEEATIVVPTDELLKQFNLIAEPMYRKIEILEKQIQQAKEARDRLLPKLMSGEIEV